MASTSQYRCRWCDNTSDIANATACPFCGAPIDVRAAITTDSGWSELPPIKDMARIQFGQSSCQIEGKIVPAADFNLAAGDGVYFTHHLLLWKDDSVKINAMSLAGGWKRLFAGMPLIMTEAHGPGHIAFSKDAAGELIALPLQPNQSVTVREHVFMVATSNVTYSYHRTGIWFETIQGNDKELHFPIGQFIDTFTATNTPGLLILHGAGNVFIRHLEANQAILIKPSALLFKDPTVRMHLHIEQPAAQTWSFWRPWNQRYLWLRLHGPGRVAVQSQFDLFEDNGNRMSSAEPLTTQRQW